MLNSAKSAVAVRGASTQPISIKIDRHDPRARISQVRLHPKGLMLVHMGIDREEVSILLKSTHELVQSSCTAIAESLKIVAKTTERVRATQRRLEEVDSAIERLRLFSPIVIADQDAAPSKKP